jgi:uncharacterized protein
MHEMIEQKRTEIEALCQELRIRRLDLFGSAAGGLFDPDTSNVDVLVEFDVQPGFDYFGTYFDLKEGLERILGYPVDVISATSIRNPLDRGHETHHRTTVRAHPHAHGIHSGPTSASRPWVPGEGPGAQAAYPPGAAEPTHPPNGAKQGAIRTPTGTSATGSNLLRPTPTIIADVAGI